MSLYGHIYVLIWTFMLDHVISLLILFMRIIFVIIDIDNPEMPS